MILGKELSLFHAQNMSDLKVHHKRLLQINEQAKYEMEQSTKTTDTRKTILKSFFIKIETGNEK